MLFLHLHHSVVGVKSFRVLCALAQGWQPIWLDHAKHLGEALTHASDPLLRISKRHFAPGHEVDPLPVQVLDSFFAARAGVAAQVLCPEERFGVLPSGNRALRHYQVEEIFDLAFNQLKRLFGLLAIGVQLRLVLKHVVHSLKQESFQLLQVMLLHRFLCGLVRVDHGLQLGIEVGKLVAH